MHILGRDWLLPVELWLLMVYVQQVVAYWIHERFDETTPTGRVGMPIVGDSSDLAEFSECGLDVAQKSCIGDTVLADCDA